MNGEIDLCNFGVLERTQGAKYPVKSDLWSLGVTVIELVTSRFPFFSNDDPDMQDTTPTSPPSSQ